MKCEHCGSYLSEVYEHRGANLCFICYCDVLRSEHLRLFKKAVNAIVLRDGNPIGVVERHDGQTLKVLLWERYVVPERDADGNIVAIELIKR